MRGEWEWEIEGEKKTIIKGDVVFMKKRRKHKITANTSVEIVYFMSASNEVDLGSLGEKCKAFTEDSFFKVRYFYRD